MKQIFICETCGHQYNSDVEAVACENAHIAEAERKEKLSKEKNERRNAIAKMIIEYEKDYNETYIGNCLSSEDSIDELMARLFGCKRRGHLG